MIDTEFCERSALQLLVAQATQDNQETWVDNYIDTMGLPHWLLVRQTLAVPAAWSEQEKNIHVEHVAVFDGVD